MTIKLEDDDMIIECNVCEQELDRLDGSHTHPRMFRKPFSIICIDCMKTAESNYNSIILCSQALKSVFYTK